MTDWNGEDRRQNSGRDHDLLIRIDTNLTNFIIKFDKHTKDDEINFKSLADRTSRLEKFMWGTLAIVGTIELAVRYFR